MEPDALADGVRRGDRRALARAITLIESRREDHRRTAEDLLTLLMPATGASIRIAVSGVPGVGKSTFIETFGRHLTAAGHRLAVLAIDPSSQRSGGSILGDKTRMEALSRDPAAFVRPSPAQGTLGGVARRTREAILLCEAAGHDVVIVETVGVGQSEIAAAGMTDLFLLLLLPGAGDELQGIKRGIVEVADLLVVNKADGAMAGAANHAAAEYRHALSLLRSGTGAWTPEILQCSSVTGEGIGKVAAAVERYRTTMASAIAERRRAQARDWLWSEIGEAVREAMGRRLDAASVSAVECEVAEGRLPGSVAARRLVESMIK
jgi:LAO/AO transport system kinase